MFSHPNSLHLLLLALMLLTQTNSSAQKADRPNIVLILTDDLDYVNSSPFFDEVLPSLQILRKSGIEFTSYYASSSSCCPSRAAILSGRYGFETEVLNNSSKHGGGWSHFRDDESETLAGYLFEEGYKTAFFGKYMNGYKAVSPVYGWEEGFMTTTTWKAYQGYEYKVHEWSGGKAINDSVWTAKESFPEYGLKPEDYLTDVLTKKGLDFIERSEEKDSQPFFLMLSPTAPHIPLGPAPRHVALTKEKWLHRGVPDSPNTFSDKGQYELNTKKRTIPEDKPRWLQKTWRKRMTQQKGYKYMYNWVSALNKAPKEIDNYKDIDWYYRMGSLYAVNDMILALISSLKERGEWENTIFIFTSDNGYQFGNHGLYQKSSPYQESVRIPLIIGGGRAIPIKRNLHSDELLLNVDIAPTLLDFTGVSIPEKMTGISFKPLTDTATKNYEARTEVLLEYDGPGMALDMFPMWMSFHLKILPSFMLDYPPYHAIIKKIKQSDDSVRTYKYIEWISKPGKYRRKMRKAKSPEEKWEIRESFKKETELYFLEEDPFELDNLLYYKPDEYEKTAKQLKAEINKMYHSLINKK
jgi:N-acetylglucosamine-6-sulfatase